MNIELRQYECMRCMHEEYEQLSLEDGLQLFYCGGKTGIAGVREHTGRVNSRAAASLRPMSVLHLTGNNTDNGCPAARSCMCGTHTSRISRSTNCFKYGT